MELLKTFIKITLFDNIMKHSIKITSFLVLIFILSQIIGLIIVNNYVSYETEGEVEYKELPLNIERPEMEDNFVWMYIISAILIGTILMLGLIKLKATFITKLWFFLAITIALTIAFNVFINSRNAFIIASIISLIRIIKPNFIINNFSEIFIYGGITAIFHNVLSIKVAIILLIIISIYDYIAVYKIKHMVTLAKYQTSQNLFAGAMIPYQIFNKSDSKKMKEKNNKNNQCKTKINFQIFKIREIFNPNKINSKKQNTKKTKPNKNKKTAILGGGDMAFPLFFAAAIMKEYNILISLITVFTTTLALIYLFVKSEKNKFYPAMPYLTIGCLVGYLIILFI